MLTCQQIRNLSPTSLRQFRARRLPLKVVAEKCGVSHNTISSRLKEYKIMRNKKGLCVKCGQPKETKKQTWCNHCSYEYAEENKKKNGEKLRSEKL